MEDRDPRLTKALASLRDDLRQKAAAKPSSRTIPTNNVSASAPLAEAVQPDNQRDPLAQRGLRVVKWNDGDAQIALSKHMVEQLDFWPDPARANPMQWFLTHFTRPENIVFDLADGGGVLAISHVQPKWRAKVSLHIWHEDVALLPAGTIEFMFGVAAYTHGLIRLDAFPKRDDLDTTDHLTTAGMAARGTLHEATSYDGKLCDLTWLEWSAS